MIDIHVPKMGMQTVEVDIEAVYARVGDLVEPETVLLDIASEKTTFAVVAGVVGTVVELLVNEGDEVAVGDVVARIRPED
jgi:pyruvate/2-oxoglutarate dehydrogenase complex dihydrolipoamide acyltransferase (E2) component